MAKVKTEKSKIPGVYAITNFKCNGIKKNKGERISKEEISQMSKDKTEISHLLIEVK